MNFIAPAAAGLAALSVPIILMYMLRLRRTELPISSTFLWQQLVRDREANAPWQRLKFSWLLLLQLLILAALILALMRPFIEVDTTASGRIVLLLDASASMNATDVGESRFEEAQRLALELVGTLGEDDNMTVIRVTDVPEVLVSAASDQTLLRQAIRDAQPSESPADWSAAMTLAAAGARGADKLTVVMVSDGGISGNFPEIPGEIRLVSVGESGENLAITALASREVPGEGPQLFAQITNYGTQDAEVIFSIILDDELFSAQRYTVTAGQNADVVVNDLPPTFQTLAASLSQPAAAATPDYLALDNQAYGVGSNFGVGRILLVTPRNIFLSQIFSSLPGIEFTQTTPEAGLPNTDYDIYVFDGWLPSPLPPGDILIINPPGGVPDTFTVQETIEDINQAVPTEVLPNHPLTQYLDFDEVNIRKFKRISGFESWGSIMVNGVGAPLFVAGERNGQQIAILTFALQDSDLPLQIAFPILIANLTQWYTPARALTLTENITPGAAIVIRPLAGDNIRVTLPDGATENLALTDSPDLIFGNTRQKGIYRVEVREGDETLSTEYFAVNLFDASESRIAPQESVTVGTSTITEGARAAKGQRELWEYLALLGLLILLIEWIYYHRTGVRQISTRLMAVAPRRRSAR